MAFLAYVLGFFYLAYILINLRNLLTRIQNQFANAELNWSFAYEWLFAGLVHSIAEIVIFLLLSFPATIYCVIALPSIFQEVYRKYNLQSRE